MDPSEFWKRIEDIAFEKDISWNEISRRTGISRQNLIKNRRISTEPRLTTIIRLIDALEIEPNTLFFCFFSMSKNIFPYFFDTLCVKS